MQPAVFVGIYWLAMAAEVVIRLPYRKGQRERKVAVRDFGSTEQAMLALLSAAMFLVPFIYTVGPWLEFANYTLPEWAGWLGAALMAAAVAVFWRAHRDLGRNWSPVVEVGEEHNLITGGIYRFIRHPMYASQWLWNIAQALLLWNWIAGLIGLVVFVPFYWHRVRLEEKRMEATFRDEWRAYQARTGAVLPRLGAGE